MNKKGFTLTELLVVIMLLITVMGVSILGMKKISDESKIKNLKRIKRCKTNSWSEKNKKRSRVSYRTLF